MKICLVNYERDFNNGILTVFANRMRDELVKMGENAYVNNMPDPLADVNHHINYLPYTHVKSVNTLMITHFLENQYKLDALREGLKTADLGICMSEDMVKYLKKNKYPSNKLTYVLPAHRGNKPRQIIVTILTNVYPDGCKRESMFEELCKVIDRDLFVFRIMGNGWLPIIRKVIDNGFKNIEYYEGFDPQNYKAMLDSADYYLYFGMDEGSMATLDAVNDHLRLIVPPVGFHNELKIDHPFTTQEELNKVFRKLSENPMREMTWENYTKEHLDIWKHLHSKVKK